MQHRMSSSKMKSLLKGLRYISHVFESGKEEEIEIGNPTDVKHVAHIGWDGPSPDTSSTAPSWMNEFKSEDDSSLSCMSECGGLSRDLPKLPKSTRKSASEKGSPTKEKSRRRPSSSSRRSKDASSDDFSPWSIQNSELPEKPKKSTRRKKKSTKASAAIGGSNRSIRRSDADNMSETGSVRSMPQFDNRDDF